MSNVDPAALVAHLTAAGFPIEGRRAGEYVRFGWPDQMPLYGSLLVPLDQTAPEFANVRRAVLDELEYAVERGNAARQVLEGLET
jgi:hypothetical protein